MLSIFTTRKLLRNATSRFLRGSSAAPDLNQSPVSKAEYVPVSKPDAISELCLPSGDEQLDNLHVILIDLLQRNFIAAVRMDEDQTLRYYATDSGKKYVKEHLQDAVETLLERILGDGHA
jgi:hypothetical protein